MTWPQLPDGVVRSVRVGWQADNWFVWEAFARAYGLPVPKEHKPDPEPSP